MGCGAEADGECVVFRRLIYGIISAGLCGGGPAGEVLVEVIAQQGVAPVWVVGEREGVGVVFLAVVARFEGEALAACGVDGETSP